MVPELIRATLPEYQRGVTCVLQNELIALCAPGLTFLSYGIPEKGNAHWLDHEGSFMATADASRVWELLGAKGLRVQEDYRTAKMPRVNEGLLSGKLAWRQHDGGHTDAPNMKYFIAWVDQSGRRAFTEGNRSKNHPAVRHDSASRIDLSRQELT